MRVKAFSWWTAIGLCLVPAAASAQGFWSAIVAPDDVVTQRPSYRQQRNVFPPPGGRFGGGIFDYIKTGGRPEPIAPQYQATAMPQIGYVTPTAPFIHPVPVLAPRYRRGRRHHAQRAFVPRASFVGAFARPAEAHPVYYAPAGAPAPAYVPPSTPWIFAPLLESVTQRAAPRLAAPQAYAPSPSRAGLPQGGLPDYGSRAAAFVGSTDGTAGAAFDPIAADPGLVTRPMNPVYDRQEVAYSGHERPGTIVIDTPEKFLFLVEPGGHALRYGIGVGRPGFSWSGVKVISRKAEWPDWTPPQEMLARRPDLPLHMDGGEANPLGARALYLGSSLYRIHGTNEPYTIGTNVSSGCIRMMNQDVIDLYGRVGVGTRVVVL